MTLFQERTEADPGSKWVKGDAVDVRAWLTSLALHLVVLLAAAVLSFVLPRAAEDLAISYELPELIEEEEPLPQEFLSADEPMEDYGAQAQWLDTVLAENPNRWTLVTHHHPIYSGSEGRDNPEMRDAWQPIYDKHHVDLVLAGHEISDDRRGITDFITVNSD